MRCSVGTVQPLYAGVGPCYVAMQFGVFVFISLRTSPCLSVLLQAHISTRMWFLTNDGILQTHLNLASTHMETCKILMTNERIKRRLLSISSRHPSHHPKSHPPELPSANLYGNHPFLQSPEGSSKLSISFGWWQVQHSISC